MKAEQEQVIKENQLKEAAAKYNITIPIQLEKYRKLLAMQKKLEVNYLSFIDGTFDFSNIRCADCAANCINNKKASPHIPCVTNFIIWLFGQEKT